MRWFYRWMFRKALLRYTSPRRTFMKPHSSPRVPHHRALLSMSLLENRDQPGSLLEGLLASTFLSSSQISTPPSNHHTSISSSSGLVSYPSGNGIVNPQTSSPPSNNSGSGTSSSPPAGSEASGSSLNNSMFHDPTEPPSSSGSGIGSGSSSNFGSFAFTSSSGTNPGSPLQQGGGSPGGSAPGSSSPSEGAPSAPAGAGSTVSTSKSAASTAGTSPVFASGTAAETSAASLAPKSILASKTNKFNHGNHSANPLASLTNNPTNSSANVSVSQTQSNATGITGSTSPELLAANQTGNSQFSTSNLVRNFNYQSVGNNAGTVTGLGGLIANSSIPSNAIGTSNSNGLDPTLGAIAGTLFLDDNRDSLLGENEYVLAFTSVSLQNTSGNVVATTMSDENGDYWFTSLKPGVYQVTLEDSDTYQDVNATAKVGMGKIAGADLAVHQTIIAGTIFIDNNRDGQRNANEVSPAHTVVNLRDSSGYDFAKTTDSSGNYSFTGVAPGEYSIQIFNGNGYFGSSAKLHVTRGGLIVSDMPITPLLNRGTGLISNSTHPSDAPLRFITNQGQWDSSVKFAASGSGYQVEITGAGTSVSLRNVNDPTADPQTVQFSWTGHNSNATFVGEQRLSSTSNYFVGDDPTRWKTGVTEYGRVRQLSAGPGYDLVYYGTNDSRLQFDVSLHPGADVHNVGFEVQGAYSIALNIDGSLAIHTANATLRQSKPVAYQINRDGTHASVESRFILLGGNRVGFEVGKYDQTRELIIDPVSELSSASAVQPLTSATDSEGNLYVGGRLYSLTGSGDTDGFITKFVDGAIAWTTVIGNTQVNDEIRSLTTDSSGNIYAVGAGGNAQGTATKITQSNNQVSTVSTLELSALTTANAVAYDASSNSIVIAGNGTANQFNEVSNSYVDRAVLMRLDATWGTDVTALTLGTATLEIEKANAIALSASTTYVAGSTGNNAQFDKVSTVSGYGWGTQSVSNLTNSPSGPDSANGISLDAGGNVYLIGTTHNTNIPNPIGSLSGSSDAFVSKYNYYGTLAYTRYLGGVGDESGNAIAVDDAGNLAVVGTSSSSILSSNSISASASGFYAMLDANSGSTIDQMRFESAGDGDAVAIGHNPNSIYSIGSQGNAIYFVKIVPSLPSVQINTFSTSNRSVEIPVGSQTNVNDNDLSSTPVIHGTTSPYLGIDIRVVRDDTAQVVDEQILTADGYGLWSYNVPTNLDNGTYHVEVRASLQSGTSNAQLGTVQLSGSLTVVHSIAVATVYGTVFYDDNSNGTLEYPENAASYTTVNAYDNSGNLVAYTVTDYYGNYSLNLFAGSYTIQTWGSGSYNSSQVVVNLTSGLSTQANLPLTPSAVVVQLGTITGLVFDDNNSNGSRDASDSLASNQSIYLSDANGNYVTSTMTDFNGNYSVSLAPGTYSLFVWASGIYNSVQFNVSVNSGATTTADVALQPLQYLMSSISGYAYHDDNVNSLRDGGESTASNATVNAYDAFGNFVSSTTSDSSGYYHLTVVPGLYYVQVLGNSNYLSGGTSTYVSSGTASILDLPMSPQAVSISGNVFFDDNGNSTLDGYESIYSFALVSLIDGSGNTIGSTTADASGNYTFSATSPGQYTIRTSSTLGYDGADTPITATYGSNAAAPIGLTPVESTVDDPIRTGGTTTTGTENDVNWTLTQDDRAQGSFHFNVALAGTDTQGAYTIQLLGTGHYANGDASNPIQGSLWINSIVHRANQADTITSDLVSYDPNGNGLLNGFDVEGYVATHLNIAPATLTNFSLNVGGKTQFNNKDKEIDLSSPSTNEADQSTATTTERGSDYYKMTMSGIGAARTYTTDSKVNDTYTYVDDESDITTGSAPETVTLHDSDTGSDNETIHESGTVSSTGELTMTSFSLTDTIGYSDTSTDHDVTNEPGDIDTEDFNETDHDVGTETISITGTATSWNLTLTDVGDEDLNFTDNGTTHSVSTSSSESDDETDTFHDTEDGHLHHTTNITANFDGTDVTISNLDFNISGEINFNEGDTDTQHDILEGGDTENDSDIATNIGKDTIDKLHISGSDAAGFTIEQDETIHSDTTDTINGSDNWDDVYDDPETTTSNDGMEDGNDTYTESDTGTNDATIKTTGTLAPDGSFSLTSFKADLHEHGTSNTSDVGTDTIDEATEDDVDHFNDTSDTTVDDQIHIELVNGVIHETIDETVDGTFTSDDNETDTFDDPDHGDITDTDHTVDSGPAKLVTHREGILDTNGNLIVESETDKIDGTTTSEVDTTDRSFVTNGNASGLEEEVDDNTIVDTFHISVSKGENGVITSLSDDETIHEDIDQTFTLPGGTANLTGTVDGHSIEGGHLVNGSFQNDPVNNNDTVDLSGGYSITTTEIIGPGNSKDSLRDYAYWPSQDFYILNPNVPITVVTVSKDTGYHLKESDSLLGSIHSSKVETYTDNPYVQITATRTLSPVGVMIRDGDSISGDEFIQVTQSQSESAGTINGVPYSKISSFNEVTSKLNADFAYNYPTAYYGNPPMGQTQAAMPWLFSGQSGKIAHSYHTLDTTAEDSTGTGTLVTINSSSFHSKDASTILTRYYQQPYMDTGVLVNTKEVRSFIVSGSPSHKQFNIVNGKDSVVQFDGDSLETTRLFRTLTGSAGTEYATSMYNSYDKYTLIDGVPNATHKNTYQITRSGSNPVTGDEVSYNTGLIDPLVNPLPVDDADWFESASNFSAAVADKITGGLTAKARQGMGYDDAVNYNSKSYKTGEVVGEIADVGLQLIPVCRVARLAQLGLKAINGAKAVANGIDSVDAFSKGDIMGGLDKLAEARSNVGNMLKACFVAGTPILTPHGHKNIEDFKSYEEYGDQCDCVLARDEHDPEGPVRAKRVLQFFTRVSPVLNLHVGGRIIGTTGEHPFHVIGRGWVDAGSLQIGDELVSHDGQRILVEGIANSGQITTVYNIEVEDDHTYFVGSNGWGWNVWSHNARCIPDPNNPGQFILEINRKAGWSNKQLQEAGKKVAHLRKLGTTGQLVVSKGTPRTGAQGAYRRANKLSTTQHADHMHDLQLGGKDVLSNLSGLDKSVNTSVGSSVRAAISDGKLPIGTVISKIVLK